MMLTFWLITSGLTVLTLCLLLRPLLARSNAVKANEQPKTRSVYRQQFEELDQDRRNGILSDEQYRQARHELERRLLDEAAPIADRPTTPRRWIDRRALAGILIIVVPLCSTLLYLKLGTPLAITHPTATSMTGQAGTESGHQAPGGLESLAERLKNRLEQNPNDGVGWALLARSYVELGRHAEAVTMFEKAEQLIPDDAQLLADYADALGVLHGRKLAGKPEVLIQRAIKADPRNVKALMLAGTAAFDRKEYARAVKYWEEARSNFPPDADQELIQELTNGIAEARDLGKGPKPTAASTRPTSRPPSAGRPGPAPAISGTVTVTPELVGKTSPSDTLFVFARSVDGPPMPVAIVRASQKDLPFSFRLDDSNSPMPTRKLSGAGPVVIVARLSKSGEAMPKSGDLQGMSHKPVRPGARDVTVRIDTQIP
jgi:cytochrome c-type biogenesis protein CcmH